MKGMKILATILTLTISLPTFGQILTLDIENPAPRIEDEIEVSISIMKKDIEGKWPLSIDELEMLRDNDLGSGKIKFSRTASDTGIVTFGPFNLTVDGKEYISDTVTIRVYPKLPPEKQGVWVRQVYLNGKHQLIIEQRVPNEWKKDNKGLGSLNHDGLQFAEIDKETIDHNGLEFNFSHANTTHQNLGISEIDEVDLVSYHVLIYNIEIMEAYDGMFKLEKKHFKYFPKDIDFKGIEIK